MRHLRIRKNETRWGLALRAARTLFENESEGNFIKVTSRHGPVVLCLNEAEDILKTIGEIKEEMMYTARGASNVLSALEKGLREKSLAHKEDRQKIESVKQIYSDGLEVVRVDFERQHSIQKKRFRKLYLSF